MALNVNESIFFLIFGRLNILRTDYEVDTNLFLTALIQNYFYLNYFYFIYNNYSKNSVVLFVSSNCFLNTYHNRHDRLQVAAYTNTSNFVTVCHGILRLTDLSYEYLNNVSVKIQDDSTTNFVLS